MIFFKSNYYKPPSQNIFPTIHPNILYMMMILNVIGIVIKKAKP